MSTNIQVKRICAHCGQSFMAKTTVTKYCSHDCNRRAYKASIRSKKIEESNAETRSKVDITGIQHSKEVAKELLNVKELSIVTTLSERTIFRLIRSTDFPRIKVGHRLLFNKAEVVKYLKHKYTNI